MKLPNKTLNKKSTLTNLTTNVKHYSYNKE